jgi:hypothetical protein
MTHSENGEGVYQIREYIPEGEKEDYYFQKISVLINSSDTDLNLAVKAKIKEFKERKKLDPTFNFNITQDPNGNFFLFDYVARKQKDSIADFNILKYSMSSANPPAIRMVSYKMRSYQSDIPYFLSLIRENRTKYIDEMQNENF